MTGFLSSEVRRNPYPLYDQMRSTAPVVRDPATGIWMLFDYDSVKRVLSDHESFSSAISSTGTTSKWLVFIDPPRHSKLRALVTRAFTPRNITALEGQIREISQALLDGAAGSGRMDLAADYSIPLPMSVVATLLGIPVSDWPRFREWSDTILDLSYTVPGGPDAEKIVAAVRAVTQEMAVYLGALLDRRRSAPQDDLLTRLVEAEVDGERLTDEEILAFFQLLLVAGHETTTNLINNAVLCLLEHPGQFERLRRSPELLPSAIEEVLRYRSPLQWMMRTSRREVELRRQVVPAGQIFLPIIGSANHDPAVFPEPHRFDIARDPNPHVAFGHGIHFCLGAALSRLEARIALADLIARLPGLELADDTPWEPRKALHVHGPARLPVRFQLQNSQSKSSL